LFQASRRGLSRLSQKPPRGSPTHAVVCSVLFFVFLRLTAPLISGGPDRWGLFVQLRGHGHGRRGGGPVRPDGVGVGGLGGAGPRARVAAAV
jgi:hypothetical protein